MSQSVGLRDLAELARYKGEFAGDPEPTIATPVALPGPVLDDRPDQLVQAILRSARELQRLSEQDAAATRPRLSSNSTGGSSRKRAATGRSNAMRGKSSMVL